MTHNRKKTQIHIRIRMTNNRKKHKYKYEYGVESQTSFSCLPITSGPEGCFVFYHYQQGGVITKFLLIPTKLLLNAYYIPTFLLIPTFLHSY